MKITKEKLKQLISEELSQRDGPLGMAPNQGAVLRNFAPTGRPPDNQSRQTIATRPPYETLGVEKIIEEGDRVITIGKIKYVLKFDNKELTSGHVEPVGEYKFTIDGDRLMWNESAPTHVRFDSHLEKQIKEFSGREE